MDKKNGIEIHDEYLYKHFEEVYGEALGYGMTAIVYENAGDVIKVFYPKYGKHTAFKEAYMLSTVENVGLQAPRVKVVDERDGYWQLRMSKVEGESLLIKTIKNLSECNLDEVVNLTKKLADIHAEMNSKSGGSLPSSKNIIRAKIQNFDVLTRDEKEAALKYLDTLEDGNRLCHGDFHGNQVLMQNDGTYKIIDFADVGSGNPAGDVALTWLNLSTPPAPLKELWSQVDMADIYLNEYIEKTGMKKEEIEKWIKVQAAAFLNVAPPYREIFEKYLPR